MKRSSFLMEIMRASAPEYTASLEIHVIFESEEF